MVWNDDCQGLEGEEMGRVQLSKMKTPLETNLGQLSECNCLSPKFVHSSKRVRWKYDAVCFSNMKRHGRESWKLGVRITQPM